jgi:cytochrome c peroxidase
MGGTMNEAIRKIEIDTLYKRLFRDAYDSETVSSQKILTALKQFTLQIVSANSKFDRVKNGTASFSVQEQSGYQVFKSNCASCHTEPLFTDLSYRNIGLPIDNHLRDIGRMHVTNNRSDSLKFRVPTLRNIFASSYYTHDGRFPFVRNMINHYKSGVVQSHTLDPLLQNGIPLTLTEEDNIISFLRTLTDSSFLQNPHYARP